MNFLKKVWRVITIAFSVIASAVILLGTWAIAALLWVGILVISVAALVAYFGLQKLGIVK